MLYIRPFQQKGVTVTQVVTASSQRFAVTLAGTGTQTIRLVNSGTEVVYIELGSSTVAAVVATSMPMLPNTVETFLLPNDITHLAVIAATTGSTLYCTTGESA